MSFWSASLSRIYLWSKKILLRSRNSKEWYLIMLWFFFWRVLCSVHFSLTSHFWISYLRITLGEVVNRNSCVDMSIFLPFKAISSGSLLIGLQCVLFREHLGVNRSLCTLTNCWLFSLYHFLKLLDATWRRDFLPGLGKIFPSWVRFALQSCSFPSAAAGVSALPFHQQTLSKNLPAWE